MSKDEIARLKSLLNDAALELHILNTELKKSIELSGRCS